MDGGATERRARRADRAGELESGRMASSSSKVVA
jgi:hypothetical protein